MPPFPSETVGEPQTDQERLRAQARGLTEVPVTEDDVLMDWIVTAEGMRRRRSERGGRRAGGRRADAGGYQSRISQTRQQKIYAYLVTRKVDNRKFMHIQLQADFR